MREAQSRTRRGASVGTKLAVVTAGLMALVSSAVYFALSSSLEQTLLAAKGDSAQAVSTLFSANVSAAVDFDDAEGINEAFKHLATNEDVTAAAIWTEPTAGASGSNLKGQYVRPGHSRKAKLVRAGSVHRAWEDSTLALSVPVLGQGKRVIAHAVIEFSLRSERAKIAATKSRILVTSSLVAAALVVLLLIASRRTVLFPLQRLEESARRIERGEDGRFGSYADDEVGALAAALKQMADAVRDREGEIRQRHRDLRLVLDNVGQGFLRLSKDGLVSGEYSQVVQQWFGTPAPDVSFSQYLAERDAKFADAFQAAFEQLRDGVLPLEVSLAQAPTRISADGRVWNVDYRLLASEQEELEGVIVVITDISVLLEKERAEQAHREIIAASTSIARDAQGFAEFLREADALVQTITSSAEEDSGSTDTATLARNLHTLKGICGTMAASSMASLCHELEERLLELGSPLGTTEQLRARWSDYKARIQPVMAALDGKGIVLDPARYQAFVSALEAGKPHPELLEEARTWMLDDAQKPLERLAQSARDLAQRLGKGNLRIDILSSDLRLPRGACPALWASLVHVVRNAVDHGLECPEERGRLGKPAAGRLSISSSLEGDAFLVSVSDDGRGIDWSAVEERARALGLPHATAAELERALLAPGLTTRADVTQTSGRGVGTSALAEVVRSLGGQIHVRSTRGEGTTFLVSIPRDRIMLAPALRPS